MEKKSSKVKISKSQTSLRELPPKVFKNPFLTFLSVFRQLNKQNIIQPKEVVKRGAEMWNNLNEKDKQYYKDISKNSSRIKRRKRKRLTCKVTKKPKKIGKIQMSRSHLHNPLAIENNSDIQLKEDEPNHQCAVLPYYKVEDILGPPKDGSNNDDDFCIC